MKYQPNRNYKSDDIVMTPSSLAQSLVNYFNPQGKGLQPCKGTGNIFKYLKNADYCEIQQGKDFFEYNKKVDYVFTNPPWSQIRKFLIHSMEIADNVYFLITINHLWTKARLKDIKLYHFGIREIVTFDTPESFPQSGFQVGMVHLQKNYQGGIKYSQLEMNKRKLILAIDFDGTIVQNNYPDIGYLKEHAKQAINSLHDDLKCQIVIWTCRQNKDLDVVIKFLQDNDIHFDYVNDNTDLMKQLFKKSADTRKVYADFYIDDHNIFTKNIDWLRIHKYISDYKLQNKNDFL